MKFSIVIALWAIFCAGLVIVAAGVPGPWSSPPALTYEAVTGYPMKIYFRNIGEPILEVVAAGGVPVLSDEPLSAAQIDRYLAEVRKNVQPANSRIKGGEFVKFEIADPDGLAWKPAKIDHTTWFYVFAVVEMPRSGLIENKWVNQVCLVSKTSEPFTRCPTHNETYASR